jgi:hypothetical protein
MKIFVKELFKKKTTRNFFLIISSLVIIIVLSLSIKSYCYNILQDNKKGSFLLLQLDDLSILDKVDMSDVKLYSKVIIDDDNIYLYVDEYTYSLFSEVHVISKEEFDKMEFNNTYIFYMKNWLDYDDFINSIESLNIQYENWEYTKHQLNLTYSYEFIFNLVKVIIVITLIIYAITIFNFIIDENRYNSFYKIIGYNKMQIKNIVMFKSFLIVIIPIIISEIINLIGYIVYGTFSIYIYYIYLGILVFTILLSFIYTSLKKYK